MFLKEALSDKNIGTEPLSNWCRAVRRPSTRVNLAILVMVVTVLSVFLYFQFGNPYGNGSLAIDWRLKLVISDYRGTNYTLPEGIGTPGGILSNSTLASLGPPGYAPLSTRDGSSTIWIQSTQVAIFTFGDFYNIWGQTLNFTCVSATNYPQIGTYCTTPAEAVVYDANNNGAYDPGTDKLLNVTSEENPHVPSAGQLLSSDPHIKFYDKYSSVFRLNDTVIYDANNNVYDSSVDFVIALGSSSVVPPSGAALRSDPQLRFFDYNGNGHWDRSIPPPVLYDADKDQGRCIDRGLGLSNGKTWILFLWSTYASRLTGGCVPPGL